MPPPAGWVPPPKPGLIPLRPLTLGNILGASFQVLRRNPRPVLGFSLATQGILLVGITVAFFLLGWSVIPRLETAVGEDAEAIFAGAIGASVLAIVIPLLLSPVVIAFIQGIVVMEVQSGVLGEKLTLRQLWRRGRGRWAALVGWMFLVGVASTFSIAVLVALIVLFATTMGGVGVILAILMGFIGLLSYAALYAWLGTKLSLVPAAMLGERTSLAFGIARSWALTRNAFWRTFGIQLLVLVILSIVTSIITAPVTFLSPLLALLVDPNGTLEGTVVVVYVAIAVLSLLVSVVGAAVTSVVQAACSALLYVDLRMRKEGLDLDLIRHSEFATSGLVPDANPFLASVPGAAMPSPRPPAPQAAPNDSPWA